MHWWLHCDLIWASIQGKTEHIYKYIVTFETKWILRRCVAMATRLIQAYLTSPRILIIKMRELHFSHVNNMHTMKFKTYKALASLSSPSSSSSIPWEFISKTNGRRKREWKPLFSFIRILHILISISKIFYFHSDKVIFIKRLRHCDSFWMRGIRVGSSSIA